MSANRFAPGCECCDKPVCLHQAIYGALGFQILDGDGDYSDCVDCAPQWNLYLVNVHLTGSILTHPDYDAADYTDVLLCASAYDEGINVAAWHRPDTSKPSVTVSFRMDFDHRTRLGDTFCAYQAVEMSVATPAGTIVFRDSGEVDADGWPILCQYETLEGYEDSTATLGNAAADGTADSPIFYPIVRRRIFKAEDILDYTFTAESGGWISGQAVDEFCSNEWLLVQPGSVECLCENSGYVLEYLSAGTLVDGYYLDAQFFGTGDPFPTCAATATSCTYTCPGHDEITVNCEPEDDDTPSALLEFTGDCGSLEYDTHQAGSTVCLTASGGYIPRGHYSCAPDTDVCIYCCGALLGVHPFIRGDVRCYNNTGLTNLDTYPEQPVQGSEFSPDPEYLYRSITAMLAHANGSTFLRATEDV